MSLFGIGRRYYRPFHKKYIKRGNYNHSRLVNKTRRTNYILFLKRLNFLRMMRNYHKRWF